MKDDMEYLNAVGLAIIQLPIFAALYVFLYVVTHPFLFLILAVVAMAIKPTPALSSGQSIEEALHTLI